MVNDHNGNKINSLQGLRAVLFLMIFVFHTSMIGNITETAIYQEIGMGGGYGGSCFFLCFVRIYRSYSKKNVSIS